MNRAIILHGMPSKESYYDPSNNDSGSNSHWLPWLQNKLCQLDILAQTPEMPKPYAPNYEAWKTEFEKLNPDENTLLVGHSCGGGFIIRWLNDNPTKKVHKVVLVAPWLDIEKKAFPMFDFLLRKNIIGQTTDGFEILYSTNDMPEIQSTIASIKLNTDGIRYHEFIDYGHFTFDDMKTREFPELLQICISK